MLKRMFLGAVVAVLSPFVAEAQSRWDVSIFGGVMQPQTTVENRFSTKGSLVRDNQSYTSDVGAGLAVRYSRRLRQSPFDVGLRFAVQVFGGAEQSPFAFDSRKLNPYELVIQDGGQRLALATKAVSMNALLGVRLDDKTKVYAGGGPSFSQERLYHSFFASSSRFTRLEPFDSSAAGWGLQAVLGATMSVRRDVSLFIEMGRSWFESEFLLQISEVQTAKFTNRAADRFIVGFSLSP